MDPCDCAVTTEDAMIDNSAAAQKTPTKVVGNAGAPKVGIVFQTSENALKYYEMYGVSKGFSVVTRSSRKNWSRCDLFTSMTFSCSHYGSYNKKINEEVPSEKHRLNTSTMRGECGAQLNIVRDKNTYKWKISGFKDEHNHDFVSPSKTNLLKVNKKMPDVARNMVEAFRKENLPVHKVTYILRGGVHGFNNRSCWNHLRDVRQKIDVGDAQWVYQYFQNRALENPQFFYAIQCDGENMGLSFYFITTILREHITFCFVTETPYLPRINILTLRNGIFTGDFVKQL